MQCLRYNNSRGPSSGTIRQGVCRVSKVSYYIEIRYLPAHAMLSRTSKRLPSNFLLIVNMKVSSIFLFVTVVYKFIVEIALV